MSGDSVFFWEREARYVRKMNFVHTLAKNSKKYIIDIYIYV